MNKLEAREHHRVFAGFLQNSFRGFAIGAANIIPGLSGGTIALLLGIFERLIGSIQSIGFRAMGLLVRGRFREFVQYIDFFFLLAVFTGILFGNVLLARFFEYLFANFRILTWSFFWGLVLASLYFVGKSSSFRSLSSMLCLLCGALVAWGITALPPASGNPAWWYLFLCGVLAICSMILPGISGSYILILLGNYRLVMLEGVGNLRWEILAPFLLGSLFGVMACVRIINALFRKYRSQTFGLLCGFIAGSLRSLWPWKREVFQTFGEGLEAKEKVVGYMYFRPQWDLSLGLALLFMVLGVALVVWMERSGLRRGRAVGDVAVRKEPGQEG
ncbi:MAG: DUF368 domain-containing protein [Spirochaetota bacterium]